MFSRIAHESLVVSLKDQSLFFLYSSLMTMIMLFPIKHILNYLLTISKYNQPLLFRRLQIIFSMLLVYMCFGRKAGSFQSIVLKLNCYILMRLLMYILTSLLSLVCHLLTKFWILVSSRTATKTTPFIYHR